MAREVVEERVFDTAVSISMRENSEKAIIYYTPRKTELIENILFIDVYTLNNNERIVFLEEGMAHCVKKMVIIESDGIRYMKVYTGDDSK